MWINPLRWLRRWWTRGRQQPLGARGEAMAARYVRRTLGYRVLATNVLCPHGELDIVAMDGEILVFIEVRTRTTETFGTPESTIRNKKRRSLAKAVRWFVRSRKLGALRRRMDVIAIVQPDQGEAVVRHHKGVALAR